MFVLGQQQEVGELEVFAICCCLKISSCDFLAPENIKRWGLTGLKTNPERSHRLLCSVAVKRFAKTSTDADAVSALFSTVSVFLYFYGR